MDFGVHVFYWKAVAIRISWFGKINGKKLGHQESVVYQVERFPTLGATSDKCIIYPFAEFWLL